MSTSASIARVEEDGTVTATRLNFDGYLKHTGKELLAHHITGADELLESGKELRFIEDGEIQTYPDDMVNRYESMTEWLTTHAENFGYVFVDGKWLYAKGRAALRELNEDEIKFNA